MKVFVLGVLTILITPWTGVTAADRGIPLVIVNECERCAQPFFVPTFQFEILAGQWPDKGVFNCHGVEHNLECENGLRLHIGKIIFARQ